MHFWWPHWLVLWSGVWNSGGNIENKKFWKGLTICALLKIFQTLRWGLQKLQINNCAWTVQWPVSVRHLTSKPTCTKSSCYVIEWMWLGLEPNRNLHSEQYPIFLCIPVCLNLLSVPFYSSTVSCMAISHGYLLSFSGMTVTISSPRWQRYDISWQEFLYLSINTQQYLSLLLTLQFTSFFYVSDMFRLWYSHPHSSDTKIWKVKYW